MKAAKYYYLRIGGDWIDDATRHPTKAAAVREYRRVAGELGRYGQAIDGTIHIAACRAEIAEYPDFALSIGERGGVVVETT
jgi:hypothetical protein